MKRHHLPPLSLESTQEREGEEVSPAPFQDRPPPCPILSQTAQTKRERWTREGKEGRTTDIFPVVVIVVEIRQIKERERGKKRENSHKQIGGRLNSSLPPFWMVRVTREEEEDCIFLCLSFFCEDLQGSSSNSIVFPPIRSFVCVVRCSLQKIGCHSAPKGLD